MKFIVHEDMIDAELTSGLFPISSDVEKGFKPSELLVASIASGTGLVFQSILKKQRIHVESLTIETEAVQNEKEANRIEKIILLFTVKGKNLNGTKLQRNLELTRKNCTIVRSVEGSIEVEKKLTIIDE